MNEAQTTKSVNLVADLGEGYGNWRAGDDGRLLDIVSAANVACGFHAGDPLILDRTVGMCVEKGVAVGAHPGFDDKRNFGRVRIDLPQNQLYSDILYQLGAIKAFTDKHGTQLSHVSPHGRLGNLCVEEEYFAEPVFRAIHDFDPTLKVAGSPHGILGSMAQDAGHPLDLRGCPDRNYTPKGTLVRRTEPDALIKDADEVVARALTMVTERQITAVDGVTTVPIPCDTILLHGDKPEALETAEKLSDALRERGITIKA